MRKCIIKTWWHSGVHNHIVLWENPGVVIWEDAKVKSYQVVASTTANGKDTRAFQLEAVPATLVDPLLEGPYPKLMITLGKYFLQHGNKGARCEVNGKPPKD